MRTYDALPTRLSPRAGEHEKKENTMPASTIITSAFLSIGLVGLPAPAQAQEQAETEEEASGDQPAIETASEIAPDAAAKAPTSAYATLDQHQIHYIDSGEIEEADEAIVLIHGWGSDLSFLMPQFEGLRDRARVIAIDLPGHGRSDAPKIEYSMDLFARAIARVLDDAGVKRAVLIGHSNGVPTIRQFYRHHPKRTLALICIDGALKNVWPEGMMEMMLPMLEDENYKENLKNMLTMMASMSQLSAEQLEHIRTVMLDTPRHVLIGAMKASADKAIWTDDKITVPTLVVNAPNPMWPSDYEEQIREIAPELAFERWQGVGHFLMMEQPERFNTRVVEFLDAQELLE